MAMIDTGIKIEVATAAGATAPVTAWRKLNDIISMPAMIQPSSKIAVDFIGDEYTSEILGKKSITGLDFVLAFDGSDTGSQFKFLCDADDNNTQHWFRVTYPDGTKFELLANFEVTMNPPTASAVVEFTLSVTPVRNSVFTELINVLYKNDTDPLNATVEDADGQGE